MRAHMYLHTNTHTRTHIILCTHTYIKQNHSYETIQDTQGSTCRLWGNTLSISAEFWNDSCNSPHKWQYCTGRAGCPKQFALHSANVMVIWWSVAQLICSSTPMDPRKDKHGETSILENWKTGTLGFVLKRILQHLLVSRHATALEKMDKWATSYEQIQAKDQFLPAAGA